MPMDPHTRQKITPLMARIRDHVLRRGENAFRDLAADLRIQKANAVAKLTNEELKKTLCNFGVIVSTQEVAQLQAAFRDEVGYILVHDFFAFLVDTLNARRKAVVDAAFDRLDAACSGSVSIEQLKGAFDPRGHPLVLRAERSEEEALAALLAHFDATRNPDGRVTRVDFERFYAAVSASISDDDFFDVMMRVSWRLDERHEVPKREKSFLPEPTIQPSGHSLLEGTFVAPSASLRGGSSGDADFHRPKRIAGYTGHVPLAQERYGETFHQVESQTPELPKKPHTWVVGSFVDESNAFVRKGNKANAHSFKFA